MEKKFLVDLNLNGNELKKASLEKVNSLPENPFEGQIVLHDGQIKYYRNSTDGWVIVESGGQAAELEKKLTPHSTDTIEVSNNSDTTVGGKVFDVKLQSGDNDIESASTGLKVAPYTADETTITKSGKQFSVKSGVFVEDTTYQTDKTAMQDDIDSKVASVTAGDNSVTIGGTATAPTVAVKISQDTDNTLEVKNDGLFVNVPEEVPYTGSDAIDVTNKAISLKINTNDKVLSQAATGLLANISLTYDSDAKLIKLMGKDATTPISEINATDFIKDGMLDSVELVENPTGKPAGTYLKFTFNVDAGKEEIYVNVTDLIDVYTAGNGIDIIGKAVSVKLDPTSEGYLTLSASGLKVSGIDAAIEAAAPTFTSESGNVPKVNITRVGTTNEYNVQGSDLASAAKLATVDGADTVEGSFRKAVKDAKTTIDAYTVNSKAINTNPVLDGGDIAMTGYIAPTGGVVAATDTVNQAVNKLDTEVATIKSEQVLSYKHVITAATSSPVTIAASTHGCGKFTIVQSYLGNDLVEVAVTKSTNGDINISWNGVLIADLTIIIMGNPSLT